jgi:ABC-type branched-subunit amino acid transport system substrate-binding protein
MPGHISQRRPPRPPNGRGGGARTRAQILGVLVPFLLVAAACGHDESPEATPPADTATTVSPPASDAVPGDLGSLKGLCGPGTPGPADARGVSGDTIRIGVLNDATSTISPGLGAIFVTVAEAFSSWCNQAGGINGRRIEIVARDAQITQGAGRIVDACQSDFMLVGGATPFDATTVAPRLECGLGSIPAYAASPEATSAGLQALPTRTPSTQVNVALLRLLAGRYGDALHRIGILAADVPSLLAPAQSFESAVPAAGGTVTSFQKLPLSVDNFRTFVQPLVGRAEALVPPPSDPTALFRAMNDVGYQPALLLDPIGVRYTDQTITALAASPVSAPFYLTPTIYPLDLAADNPTLQRVLEITEATGTDLPVDGGIVGPWAAWILFAQAATACGADLTVDCVIAQATTETGYTAGGLVAPVDLSDPQAIGACRVVISATVDGFTYDRELTRPTDGVYNCDPANVVKLR